MTMKFPFQNKPHQFTGLNFQLGVQCALTVLT